MWQHMSYKISRFINKRLENLLNLPHIYNVENSQEVAQELLKLQTTKKTTAHASTQRASQKHKTYAAT